jgi:hypothetical protein
VVFVLCAMGLFELVERQMLKDSSNSKHIARIASGARNPKVLVPGRWKSSPQRQLG